MSSWAAGWIWRRRGAGGWDVDAGEWYYPDDAEWRGEA